MFRTVTNGTPYEPLFGTLDEVNNIVTRLNLNSLTDLKLTLGDKNNPLPVSLVAFTATRSGGNTLLSWTTASEENNTGFEVQVSTDGANFRKLAFVTTQNGNSTQKLVYAYTDTEIGKTGVRYYRLRQIDTDETEAFSPVRAVSFSGNASVATALAGYPNPFTNKLDFNLDATAVGNGVAHIQLVDMTGRIVLEQNLKVANASLTLTDLDGLRSGLYLAKVTLPDGTTQKVRVQKQ
ncbi:MAG: T9SS type A sorting domain-containing protein [Hymenobacter sp.]|nr:MAG: T9SS type A sorting domain-containing protein [Hymenobacter sp.]